LNRCHGFLLFFCLIFGGVVWIIGYSPVIVTNLVVLLIHALEYRKVEFRVLPLLHYLLGFYAVLAHYLGYVFAHLFTSVEICPVMCRLTFGLAVTITLPPASLGPCVTRPRSILPNNLIHHLRCRLI